MKKIANVIFPYIAKNDDELNLIVGDKIEVLGLDEEGKFFADKIEMIKRK